jgi:peptidoglycan/LPS O-acetylase OafA/YrhL
MSTNSENHDHQAIRQRRPPQAANEGASAMDLCNSYIFTISVSIILIEFLGSFLTNSDAVAQGLPIKPSLYDIPLIFGLLVLVCANFNFYTRIIQPRGESALAALYSLIGMLSMASLPILTMNIHLAKFRFIFLGCYAVLVVIKNEQLKRRFKKDELGMHFQKWSRMALYHLLAAGIAGIIYYMAISEASRQTGNWISLGFSSLFMIVIIVRFVSDQDGLNKITTTQSHQ